MAKVKNYIPRLAEKTLVTKLNSSGCVLMTGPKFCGKSTMCEEFARSVTALKTTNAIELARLDPRSALLGENPILLMNGKKPRKYGMSSKTISITIISLGNIF